MGMEDRDWYRNQFKEARKALKETAKEKPVDAQQQVSKKRGINLVEAALLVILACAALWFFK